MSRVALLVLVSALLSLGDARVHPTLKQSLQSKASVNIFISFQEGTDKTLAQVESQLSAKATTHVERTTAVYTALKALADKSQGEVLSLLNNYPNLKVVSFWITNQVYVEGATKEIVNSVNRLLQVSQITEEVTFHIDKVWREPEETRKEQRAEWHLDHMGVSQIWAEGINGTGLVIGNIDTGVRETHESFVHKWVGLNGHGWYDPRGRSSNPHDVYNHGTHTMGTLVGDRGIGAAPGANWMACKGYQDDGTGYQSDFVACGQYLACPHDYLGNNPNCSKAPHVVSNSWGLWGGNAIFNPVQNAWIAAGILSSFSAGNTGDEGCVSNYSPADQPRSISVGATDNQDRLAYFSSLGPSPNGQLKPEFSAPGVNIMSASATGDSSYVRLSGTSMSCPNASGVIALLKAYNINLSHDRVLEALTRTAVTSGPITGGSCGGIRDDVFPNNHKGHGRINGFAALQYLRSTQ